MHVATLQKISEPMCVPRVSVTSSIQASENLGQVRDAQDGTVSAIVPLHGKDVVSIQIIDVSEQSKVS